MQNEGLKMKFVKNKWETSANIRYSNYPQNIIMGKKQQMQNQNIFRKLEKHAILKVKQLKWAI